MQKNPVDGKKPPLDKLSKVEAVVWDLLGKGLSTREIAGKLSRDIKTIETHYKRIEVKLELQNLDELRRKARQFRKK